MNIVIAIDSFKGSLTSLEAGRAVAEGIRRVSSDDTVTVLPLADGGEGTVGALVSGLDGRLHRCMASDPLGRAIECIYGICRGENNAETAVIEMSAAAGITLLSDAERNPMVTTSYGVGEIIRDAIREGIRDFIIGIGGSATNDGGAGMLQALGFELLDSRGNPIRKGAVGLSSLAVIRRDNALPELGECRFRVACDVKNPLCGKNGCSAVFAPQKGASPDSIDLMDGWLNNFAELTKEIYPLADPDSPGSGAAGGLGFALSTYLGASLEPGCELILEVTGFNRVVKEADLIITGEGRLDGQTVMGKALIGVARAAKKYGKLCIAFSGSVTPDASECNIHGIDAFFPILRNVVTLGEAMNPDNAHNNLADTAEQVFRLINLYVGR